jgi:hypothetical protein
LASAADWIAFDRIRYPSQGAALAVIVERSADGGFEVLNRAFEPANRTVEAGHPLASDLAGVAFRPVFDLVDDLLKGFVVAERRRDPAALLCIEQLVRKRQIVRQLRQQVLNHGVGVDRRNRTVAIGPRRRRCFSGFSRRRLQACPSKAR